MDVFVRVDADDDRLSTVLLWHPVVDCLPTRWWSLGWAGREGQDCEGNCLETRLLSGHCPSGKPLTSPPSKLTGQQLGHEVNRKHESNSLDGNLHYHNRTRRQPIRLTHRRLRRSGAG